MIKPITANNSFSLNVFLWYEVQGMINYAPKKQDAESTKENDVKCPEDIQRS